MNKTVFNVFFGIAVLIFIGAWFYGGTIKARYATDQDAAPEAMLDRIRPFGDVAVEGAMAPASSVDQPVATVSEPANAQPPAGSTDMPPVIAQATAAPADNLGQETYAGACAVCHTAGLAGAPKLGDVEGWAPRIAQGANVLNEHAIKGYQGSAGVMPPKGGRLDLSDEAVIAAVAYMVQESEAP